jgi:hypothetical protein
MAEQAHAQDHRIDVTFLPPTALKVLAGLRNRLAGNGHGGRRQADGRKVEAPAGWPIGIHT